MLALEALLELDALFGSACFQIREGDTNLRMISGRRC